MDVLWEVVFDAFQETSFVGEEETRVKIELVEGWSSQKLLEKLVVKFVVFLKNFLDLDEFTFWLKVNGAYYCKHAED